MSLNLRVTTPLERLHTPIRAANFSPISFRQVELAIGVSGTGRRGVSLTCGIRRALISVAAAAHVSERLEEMAELDRLHEAPSNRLGRSRGVALRRGFVT